MINKLLKVNQWSKWDIQVEPEPEIIESRRLAVPELEHNEGRDVRLFVNEPLLKKLPVYNGDQLKRAKLLLLYDETQIWADTVQNIQRNLTNCQK